MSAQIENIYFVDKNDVPTGELGEKLTSHDSDTKLHAAFSCYVFNKKGEFLVTQRAHVKKVWHGVWTNSCCGHPFPGESREEAMIRRLEYELGLKVKNIKLILPEYIYKTPPYNSIIEHEYCPVYVAIADSDIFKNDLEVEDYKWVDWGWYVDELRNDSKDYSVFARSVPEDSELGKRNVPKWSWWANDQLSYLKINPSFIEFLGGLNVKAK
jgi:isopentenyl-diphosphate delta-isomerase